MFFSVIIPTENRTRSITHAISSLILQTHPDWEAIILDTGTDPRIASIIHPLLSQDRRIRYLLLPPDHITHPRAWGISAARGDIITYIDANDYISPTHLQVHHDYFVSHPHVDMLYGKPTIIGSPYIGDTHIHHSVIPGTFFIKEHLFDTITQLPKTGSDEGLVFHSHIQRHGFITKEIPMPTYIYDRS